MVGVIGVVLLGGVFTYLGLRKPKSRAPTQVSTRRVTTAPEGVEPGEEGFQEPETTVVIGSEEVSRGNFEKAEGGQLYYKKLGVLTALSLTEDEVVLACTNQDLNTAVELDYDQIVSIKTTTPAEIAGQIPTGEMIVVFATDIEGVFRAHTVALAASSCK